MASTDQADRSTVNKTVQPTPATPATMSTVSAQNAHQALVAIGVLMVFVILATIVAGVNADAGKAMLALMFAMLLLQGIGHINPITEWMAKHPLIPATSK